MGGSGGGGGDGLTKARARQLDQTPTWAVASVCAIIIIISIFLEKLLHHIGEVILCFLSYLLFFGGSIPSYDGSSFSVGVEYDTKWHDLICYDMTWFYRCVFVPRGVLHMKC